MICKQNTWFTPQMGLLIDDSASAVGSAGATASRSRTRHCTRKAAAMARPAVRNTAGARLAGGGVSKQSPTASQQIPQRHVSCKISSCKTCGLKSSIMSSSGLAKEWC